jgi:hypothetical protein
MACLLMTSAMMLAGCGPQEFGSPEETKNFITSIATGGKISDWKPADAAGENAISAWGLRSAIHDLGVKLRDKEFPWACDTAHQVETAHTVIEGIHPVLEPEVHARIVATAVERGANRDDVVSLIEEVLKLGPWEQVKVVAAACRAAKEL